jgi:hypothetical protein
MKLSEAQVEMVERTVDAHNITIDTLRDDVVDHLCCVIEHKLSNGTTFDTALKEAMNELAPGGLKEIEEETIFLLNHDKILYMKKVIYLVGLLSTMSFSIGWTFRLFQWPGGVELINYGLLAFAFLFVPMMAVNHFKFKIQRAPRERWYMILGLLSAVLIGLTVIFKYLHLQGADILLLCWMCIFSFAFLPLLFFNLYKKAEKAN